MTDPALDALMAGLEFPSDLHYCPDRQMWVGLQADGSVRIGITALGIHVAGEIYMCRPRRVHTVLQPGDSLAVVELAKSIVSVKSPLGGTVLAVNPLLEDQPELVHRDPYGAGWIAALQPADWARDGELLLSGAAVLPAMREYAWRNRLERG